MICGCCIANIFRMNHWWDPWSQIPRAGHWSRLRYLVTRPSVATSTQFSASLSLSQASHPAPPVSELSSVFTPGHSEHSTPGTAYLRQLSSYAIHYTITLQYAIHYTRPYINLLSSHSQYPEADLHMQRMEIYSLSLLELCDCLQGIRGDVFRLTALWCQWSLSPWASALSLSERWEHHRDHLVIALDQPKELAGVMSCNDSEPSQSIII